MSGPIRRPQPTFRRERLAVFDPASPPPALARLGLPARLLALWRGWAGGRAAPERTDIDPLAMPALLPHLILLDAIDGDFRFRLVGEAVNSRYGHGLKGRALTELMSGAALDETLYEHRRCAEDLAGVLVQNSLEQAGLDDLKLYARLLLPVGADGGRARHVIGVMEFLESGGG